ncbi:tRNA (adenine-N(1)-)-methyltransferase catalytic subunit trm61 [Monascus purpureus]|uniref:tRNA (adenine(58)-N(1))-methyltransferase catalytic subunit TRM61 n=1 Tax=Monascus purpureus TaxID=5098 RepID=A0A507QY04_MONPU|nr:tRNA (adenine-N(1)-)-methyltransferase catalytic subunit trm61 [Monascus purpureus]BDD55992.1 tRNA (adenine-N(1)-)-methyltransferase catalytic subunit trm61 [Monascus purpureus]
MQSPFLTPSLQSRPDSLALLQLRRDDIIPTILRTHDDEQLGYDEGKVTNTRYGSFPHSTLLNQPWGSQLAASKVDTGSRGRRPAKGQKRKADELEEGQLSPKAPVQASSGFLHLICPTPESWTASLPHRTQVVYAPDYSYILERLRVRPGSTIIEAGSGSGSFTHAAARAVFNGYPAYEPATKRRRLGKVCSFEFHQQRAGKVTEEIKQHGLDGIVQVTHRDVYNDGFLLGDPTTGASPKANAVFLDLPAPWLALKHLVRKPSSGSESPLDPLSPIHICTFSPCLEQVQRTISAMRQLGWLMISMVEVQHRRIEVKREITGLDAEGIRGAVIFPKSVDEAITKARVVEERARAFHDRFRDENYKKSAPIAKEQEEQEDKEKGTTDKNPQQDNDTETPADAALAKSRPSPQNPNPKPNRKNTTPPHKLGRLVHRSELDLKTHTSYLVFAVLPRDWSEEDELKCQQAWPSNSTETASQNAKPKSKTQMKREAKAQRDKNKQPEKEEKSAPEQTGIDEA